MVAIAAIIAIIVGTILEPAAGLEVLFPTSNEKDGGAIAASLEQRTSPPVRSGAIMVPAESGS